MVTEIELKYSLLETQEMGTSEQIKTTIDKLFSNHQITFIHKEKRLSNYYFDTSEFTLRKSRIALRTRGTKSVGEEERFEQTIKTSGTVIAGLHQRPEYNFDIDNAKPLLALFPATLWQTGTDIKQLQQNIIELFSTNFTRHTWLVTIDNTQIEVAFDCGEIACLGHANKPRIYEVELELVSGDTQALFGLTKLLFTKLALRPGQLTKAARGYALYRESIATESVTQSNVESQQSARAIINLTTDLNINLKNALNNKLTQEEQINDVFTDGISSTLTQLQLSVDAYVAYCFNNEATNLSHSEYLSRNSIEQLSQLNKVKELLILLRHGFWLFNDVLTDDAIKLRNELSYFIQTLQWVDKEIDNVRFRHLWSSSVLNDLTTDNQDLHCELEVLTLLHSERFNQLQVDLLILILNKNVCKATVASHFKPCTLEQSQLEPSKFNLVYFSAKQLTNYTKALCDELTEIQKTEKSPPIDDYKVVQRLLNRALLTISWFSSVFIDSESDIIKMFNSPLLEIKENIRELQWLALQFFSVDEYIVQQQLNDHSLEIEKLMQRLVSKNKDLFTKLEQSCVKSLTMKPYWPDYPLINNATDSNCADN